MNKYKAIKINGKKMDVHRLIMEKQIGRKLGSKEIVHHIDGNPENNDISNLALMSLSKHSKHHMSGRKLSVITKDKLRGSSRCARTAAKLQISDISIIRKMLRDDIKQWLIAFIYQVNLGTISKIKRGVSWAWVG